jgi:hypothetical protein
MPCKPSPSNSAVAEAPYDVGYGKPPKHTQFKPGHSGNPRGRRRGQQNFKTVIKQGPISSRRSSMARIRLSSPLRS